MALLDKFLLGDLFKAAHGRYADNAKNRRLHRVGQEYGHAAQQEQGGEGRKPAQQDDEHPDRLNYLMDANVGDEFEDKSYASYSMGSDSVGRTVDFKVTLLARKGQSVLPIYSDRKQGEREFIANRDSKYRVLQKGFNSLVVEMI